MVKSVEKTKCYNAAMKNAMAIASFLIAVPSASFAKNTDISGAFNLSGKKTKVTLSDEAASVDIGSKSKSVSLKSEFEKKSAKLFNTKNNKKPINTDSDKDSKTQNSAKATQTENDNQEVAKIFNKPFYTKVGLKGYEVEKVSTKQMALELGLSNSETESFNSGQKSTSKAPWQKIGAPYKVNGMWYIPAAQTDYDETGVASWYGVKFHGKNTANGEVFDMNEISIAHPTLPIPCLVEVTNLENGLSIIARVNDRGPFANDRLIDVSAKAATLLGFKNKGTAKVRVKYVGIAPDSDDGELHNDKYSPQLPEVIKNQKLVENKSPNKTKLADANKKQIGAFTDQTLAKKFAAQQNKDVKTEIVEAQIDGKMFYRVFVTTPSETNSKKSPIQDHNSILASL